MSFINYATIPTKTFSHLTHFLNQCKKYMPLGRLIDAWKNARKLEQTLSFLPPSHIQEKAKDLVEEIEKLF